MKKLYAKKKPVGIEYVPFEEFDKNYEKDKELFIGETQIKDIQKEGDVYLVRTLEGIHKFTKNDVLIRGVKGELYPCKKEIFDMTYDYEITHTEAYSKHLEIISNDNRTYVGDKNEQALYSFISKIKNKYITFILNKATKYGCSATLSYQLGFGDDNEDIYIFKIKFKDFLDELEKHYDKLEKEINDNPELFGKEKEYFREVKQKFLETKKNYLEIQELNILKNKLTDENEVLQNKVTDLKLFMERELFTNLNPAMKSLLKEQLASMIKYQTILEKILDI